MEVKDIDELHKNPPYGMIIILFIGAFAAILNNTLLNIALPTIMDEFNVDPSRVQWVTTSYMLTSGILIPASAFFIQKYTNRALFLSAMGLFTFGTALALFSPTFTILIMARVIQASGSALMMPLLMNIMLAAFPMEKRGTAMGFFGLVMFVAPAIGPTLSGWVIEHYSWRMLFVIVLPFGVLTFIYAYFKLKNITPTKEIYLDYFSILLSSLGFGGILYGFSSAGNSGWTSPIVMTTIIIGAISLTLFIIRQFKLDEPMLDFRVYKYPMFTLASIISITISIAMFSGMILTPLYVQTIREISPFYSGILMLPGAIIMGIMSPITGKLFDRYGPKILSSIGLIIMIVSTYMMSNLTMELTYFYLMTLYTVRMFGMSLVMMPIMTNGLNELPMSYHPHGTAMNNTFQQVSGAIGTAVMLTIMTKRSESAAPKIAEQMASGELNTPYSLEHLATLEGINFAFLVSTLIAVIAFIMVLFIRRVKAPHELIDK